MYFVLVVCQCILSGIYPIAMATEGTLAHKFISTYCLPLAWQMLFITLCHGSGIQSEMFLCINPLYLCNLCCFYNKFINEQEVGIQCNFHFLFGGILLHYRSIIHHSVTVKTTIHGDSFVPKGAARMVSQSVLLLVLLAVATCSGVVQGECSSTGYGVW